MSKISNLTEDELIAKSKNLQEELDRIKEEKVKRAKAESLQHPLRAAVLEVFPGAFSENYFNRSVGFTIDTLNKLPIEILDKLSCHDGTVTFEDGHELLQWLDYLNDLDITVDCELEIRNDWETKKDYLFVADSSVTIKFETLTAEQLGRIAFVQGRYTRCLIGEGSIHLTEVLD